MRVKLAAQRRGGPGISDGCAKARPPHRRVRASLLCAALGGLVAALAPNDAWAASCVKVDEQRDALTEEERRSVVTLLEDSLT
jgi:hypothetical protein